MSAPIYTTVAFKSVDRAAFDVFWADIRERYKFAGEAVPTQAFAVSMGDKFAEEAAVDALIGDKTLDEYDLREAIGRVPCCSDLPALLAEYGVEQDA